MNFHRRSRGFVEKTLADFLLAVMRGEEAV